MTVIRIAKKFGTILNRHQKFRIFELTILMIIAGFMEMLSVSMVVPFIEALTNPDEFMNNQFAKVIAKFWNIPNYRSFLVIIAVVMASLYIVKNAFLLFQMRCQKKFVYNNMLMIRQKLLHSFLLRPYEYFLGAKSGEIIRIIGDDTTIAFGNLTMMLSLFSELIVSGTLITTSFIIAPQIMLAMAIVLLILITIIQFTIRPTLRKAGEQNLEAFAGMNQWLLQSIQGIKEIKLMMKESFFENSFMRSGRIYVRTTYQKEFLSNIPRFMVEAVAMAFFFIDLAVMIYRGVSFEMLIPVVSGVAMAAVRLLPSINRISQCLAQLAFGEAAVDKLIENLDEVALFNEKLEKKLDEKRLEKFDREIEMSEVSYRYPSGESDVLNHANIIIKKGKSVGFVGVSGSGKTTAVDVLLGLLMPWEGEVLVDGLNIQSDMRGWLSNIGYIPQFIFMLDASILENVAFGISPEKIDEELVWKALRDAALEDFVKTLPEGLLTQIGERGVRLSGGQRQRIGIARALYSNPSVLFFDEATSALDNDTEAEVMNAITHLKGIKTMIIIAHRLSTIESCDEIYRVENGKIKKDKNVCN